MNTRLQAHGKLATTTCFTCIMLLLVSGCSSVSFETRSGRVIVEKQKPNCVIINDTEECVEEQLITED